MPMNDDLAILFFYWQKLVARAFSERFGRLFAAVSVDLFGRKRKRGNDGDTRFHPRLAERREQSHFIYGVQADAIGDIPQKTFSRFNHARAFTV